MHKTIQLRVTPDLAADPARLRLHVAREEAIDARTINALLVRRRSIDARQRTIYVNLSLDLYVNEEPPQPDFSDLCYGDVSGRPRVIVVGAGPGGLFAALRLVELGLRPVVVERGKDVHERRRDIARISREHRVDPESNYSFGEGGAFTDVALENCTITIVNAQSAGSALYSYKLAEENDCYFVNASAQSTVTGQVQIKEGVTDMIIS